MLRCRDTLELSPLHTTSTALDERQVVCYHALSHSFPSSLTITESSSRRDLFQKGATLAAGAAMAMGPSAAIAYTLPDLPYPFEALEPYIDAPTMKIHHDKHHGTYVAGINKWAEGKDEVPILDLMADALEAGAPVRNSGGGHYNHAFFWTEMAPPGKFLS